LSHGREAYTENKRKEWRPSKIGHKNRQRRDADNTTLPENRAGTRFAWWAAVRAFSVVLLLTTAASATERSPLFELELGPTFRRIGWNEGAPTAGFGFETQLSAGYDFHHVRVGGAFHFGLTKGVFGASDCGQCSDVWSRVYELETGPMLELLLGSRVRLGVATLFGVAIHEYLGGDGYYAPRYPSVVGRAWLSVDVFKRDRRAIYLSAVAHVDILGESNGASLDIGARL
jgi:hypothetical protein